MTSLLDIAPPDVAFEEVPIDRVGKTLRVWGLSGRDIAKLIKRFPQFRRLAQQKDAPDGEQLMEVGVDLAPAIIALGLHSPDKETEELVLTNLTEDEQADLINAIMRLTNPDGDKKKLPFTKARTGRRRGGVAGSGREAAGTSPSP